MAKGNGKLGKPSNNGPNGRAKNGTFLKGNPGGPGNPHMKHIHDLRSAMMKAVTKEALAKIARKMVQLAQDGDVNAAREILTRCIGKPAEAMDAEALVEKIIVRDDAQAIFAGVVIARAQGQAFTPEVLNRSLEDMDSQRLLGDV